MSNDQFSVQSHLKFFNEQDSNFVEPRALKKKHIFHKGSKSGTPLASPNMWLDKEINKLHVNINTFHSIKESCDIDNIPVNKWFHIALVVINKSVMIRVNDPGTYPASISHPKQCNLFSTQIYCQGVGVKIYTGFE
jgi:hypothetical protein